MDAAEGRLQRLEQLFAEVPADLDRKIGLSGTLRRAKWFAVSLYRKSRMKKLRDSLTRPSASSAS